MLERLGERVVIGAKIIILTGLLVATPACGQAGPQDRMESGVLTVSGAAEIVSINPSVAIALKKFPEAEPYVDTQSGDFDYGTARGDMAALKAKQLERNWNVALSEIRAND